MFKCTVLLRHSPLTVASMAMLVILKLLVVLIMISNLLSQAGLLEHMGGGILGGKALGNVQNIGDFDSVDANPQSVDVEGTINIFLSNSRPTTMDIDETAVIAVTIPFEDSLAPLLSHVAKYYSPISGRYFKSFQSAII